MSKLQILILLCTVAALEGCRAGEALKESSFKSLYANCDMNSTVIFLPAQPELRQGHDIVLDYHNTSEDSIAFPADSGVKIYYYDVGKKEWRELNNRMQYSAGREGYILAGPASEPLISSRIVIIWPDLSEGSPEKIRIAITGHVFRDDEVTDECVGAFVDIKP